MTECDPTSQIAELKTEIARLQEQIKGMTDARDLQAMEYQRRLDELNHAHAQHEARNANYLPRELYETTISEITNWRREVDAKLSQASGNRAGVIATVAVVMAILSMLLTLFPFISTMTDK